MDLLCEEVSERAAVRNAKTPQAGSQAARQPAEGVFTDRCELPWLKLIHPLTAYFVKVGFDVSFETLTL